MHPDGDFEVRFFAALGALASLLLHAAVLLVFLTGRTSDEPTPPPLTVEIVRERTRAPDEGSPPAPDTPPPPAPASDERVPDDEDALAPATDYRERLRRREQAFQRDMAVRDERVATLERFLAERDPVPAATDGDAVSLCDATSSGERVLVRGARSMARYADLTPVGLFPPRYLDEVAQIARDGDRLGRIEMALPTREVVVQLDHPAGAVFAVGRRDARCLVGFSWSRDVFPLRFRNLPTRYIDADDRVRELVMDVVLHVDATFEVTVVSGDELPFTKGALYDQHAVARNLQQRATGARVVRDFLGALLGG